MDHAARLPTGTPRWVGALAGLLAGLLAVAAGTVVAYALHRPTPVDAVGSACIEHSPAGLKHWAIEMFGHHDKLALRVGIALVMGAAAAAIGIGALRRWWTAPLGVGAVALVGVAAGVSRPGSGASAAWPPLLGGLVAVGVLAYLLVGSASTEDHADVRDGADGRDGVARLSGVARPGEVPPGSPEWPVVRSWPRRSLAWRHYDRRRFLWRSAATVGGIGFLAAASRNQNRDTTRAALASAPERLPPPTGEPVVVPAHAQLDGATPYVTSADDFYRIDTAFTYPRIRADRWKLTIGGLVDRPLTITYDELLRRPQVERMITLTCVSNEVGGDLVGNARWQGVLLRDLLAEARPRRGAQQVATASVDGFTAGFPLDVATDPTRDALVAVGMNGHPLPLPHGFPARLVVPGLYGYVSATKWLADIRLTTWDDFDGYWVGQGWAKRGPIKTASRIDVPRHGAHVPAGRVVVAGVAWAQHRGISKVEVQVDDGPWLAADLGDVVSADTWRQWRLEWTAPPGTHELRVRATDGRGQTQTAARADPAPDGATGWHHRTVKVVHG